MNVVLDIYYNYNKVLHTLLWLLGKCIRIHRALSNHGMGTLFQAI